MYVIDLCVFCLLTRTVTASRVWRQYVSCVWVWRHYVPCVCVYCVSMGWVFVCNVTMCRLLGETAVWIMRLYDVSMFRVFVCVWCQYMSCVYDVSMFRVFVCDVSICRVLVCMTSVCFVCLSVTSVFVVYLYMTSVFVCIYVCVILWP